MNKWQKNHKWCNCGKKRVYFWNFVPNLGPVYKCGNCKKYFVNVTSKKKKCNLKRIEHDDLIEHYQNDETQRRYARILARDEVIR